MRILIAQCLCPARHAILALAIRGASADNALALIKAAVDALLAGQGAQLGLPERIDPWCRLCGSSQWHFEAGWSKEYPDWDTAERHMRELERQGQATADLLTLHPSETTH